MAIFAQLRVQTVEQRLDIQVNQSGRMAQQVAHESHGFLALRYVRIDVDLGEQLHEYLAYEGQYVGGIGGAQTRDHRGGEFAYFGALVSHTHEQYVQVLGQRDEHVEFGVVVERVQHVVAHVRLAVRDRANEELAEHTRYDRDERAAVLRVECADEATQQGRGRDYGLDFDETRLVLQIEVDTVAQKCDQIDGGEFEGAQSLQRLD